MLKTVWNKLILIGSKNSDPEDLFAVKIVNSAVVIISIIILLDFTGAIVNRLPLFYMVPSLILLLINMLSITFNYFGKNTYAKTIFVMGLSCTFLFAVIIYGSGMGEELALATKLILVWILFQKETFLKYCMYGMVILNYVLAYYYSINYAPIVNMEDVIIDNILVFMATVLIIFSLLNLYRRNQKELYEKLEKKNKTLEIKTRELEQFAYAASHDLKTPIRNIVSFLDLASKNDRYSEEERNQFIEYARIGGRKMYYLVEDLTLFSTINSNDKKENINQLDHVFSSVEKSLEPILKQKNAVIKRGDSDQKILGNKQELFILFRNLIKNGILFNDSKEPKVSIKIDNHKEKGIKLEFSDNGVGIDPKYFNQIFDYFKRLQTDAIDKGNGIGLSLCKKIVSNMNGSIEVESEINKGTTFKVILPDCLVN